MTSGPGGVQGRRPAGGGVGEEAEVAGAAAVAGAPGAAAVAGAPAVAAVAGAWAVAGAARTNFAAAAEGFVTVVSGIGDEGWGRPGLGDWSVRDLVGHTGRALSTVETYLGRPSQDVTIRQPADYYLALQAARLDHGAVAQRGREAGAALGEHPAAAVRALADRVLALVAATPDGATLSVAGGRGATLVAYLPTRTFELTVHTLDLLRALGQEPPPVLDVPIGACLELAGRLAGHRQGAAEALLALTGRGGLPPRFTVI